MGRMKDLHIDMLNDNWTGAPNDYLEMRAKQAQFMSLEHTCPNCLTDNVAKETAIVITCVECGFEFKSTYERPDIC